MTRKKDKPLVINYIVIFVEGDAEELIFDKLIKYYQNTKTIKCLKIKIDNTQGFPSENKMSGNLWKIIQNEKAKNKGKNIVVDFKALFCEYDTDVFEKQTQKVPNWNIIEKNLKNVYNIKKFCHVKAKTSIEDWMLDDVSGLLNALGLPENTNITGVDGQEKIKNIFKKRNIYYSRKKGFDKIKPYIEKLDIEKIRNARATELKELEKVLEINNI